MTSNHQNAYFFQELLDQEESLKKYLKSPYPIPCDDEKKLIFVCVCAKQMVGVKCPQSMMGLFASLIKVYSIAPS